MIALRETFVVWEAYEEIGADGRKTISTKPPCEYLCKWEDQTKTYIDAVGNVAVAATVILTTADIPIGSYVKEGGRDCLTSTSYASNANVKKINGRASAKNTRATTRLFEYYI